MAKIMNFQMKNIKTLTGRKGYGCTASLYLDGKRIGTYADYADGGPEDVEYISKEAEEAMMKTIIAYAKKVPNKFVIRNVQSNTKKNVNGFVKPIHIFQKRTSPRRLWRPIPLYISSLVFLNCMMQKGSLRNFQKKGILQSV